MARAVFFACALTLPFGAAAAGADVPAPAPAGGGAASTLKLSGYIQAQFVKNDVSEDGAATNKDKFELRRARLKASYDNGPATAMLHADFRPSGVKVLDAEAGANLELGESTKLRVIGGLFRLPFGWELQESMSRHPFPERSIWAERLFPGVRDVGARADLAAFDGALSAQLAVTNGNTLSDSTLPGDDPDAAKDLTLRVGTKLGKLKAGFSGYFGEGFLAGAADDPATPADETTGNADFTRYAAGVDVYTEIALGIGKLVLVGEGVYAQNLDRAKANTLPKADADGAVTDKKSIGFYAGAQQYLGDVFSLAARFQQFDPDTDGDDDKLTYITLVGHAEPTTDLRLSLAYEIRNEEDESVGDDDQIWVRAQTKF